LETSLAWRSTISRWVACGDLERLEGEGLWRSTGENPAFLLRGWFAPGWHLLRVRGCASARRDPASPMSVYRRVGLATFDRAADHFFPLAEGEEPREHVLPFHVAFGTWALLFTPMKGEGRLRLLEIEIARVEPELRRQSALVARAGRGEPSFVPTRPMARIELDGAAAYRPLEGDSQLFLPLRLDAGDWLLTLHGRAIGPASPFAAMQVSLGQGGRFGDAASAWFEPLRTSGAPEPHELPLSSSSRTDGLRIDLRGQGPFVLDRLEVARRASRRVLATCTRPHERPATPYEDWLDRRERARRGAYPCSRQQGLFSVLTCAYDTPPEYLRIMGESLLAQTYRDFEWILLDNGSTRAETRAVLAELARDPRARLARVEKNQGIMGGMRHCLERAKGRYVVPFDSDDIVSEDALEIFAHFIERDGATILYSDEDKVFEDMRTEPMFKSGFDPVFLSTCCYIAHLTAIHREKALEYGCYTDEQARGCHDWDSFLRFVQKGEVPRHVPEILYGWRMHEASCALNLDSKSYILDSHRRVLTRHLSTLPHGDRFEIRANPLFPLAWWFRRQHSEPVPARAVVLLTGEGRDAVIQIVERLEGAYPFEEVLLLGEGASALAIPGCSSLDRAATPEALGEIARRGSRFLALVSDRVLPGAEGPARDGLWDAIGQCELFPETCAVASRLMRGQEIVSSGEIFGFDGTLGSPEGGASFSGHIPQSSVRLVHSTDAAASAFCLLETAFLLGTLERHAADPLSVPFLGAWIGAQALKAGRRVIYVPTLSGELVRETLWREEPTAEEREAFARAHGRSLGVPRFYSPRLGMTAKTAFLRTDPSRIGSPERAAESLSL
jgi:hypothetical protein